MRAYAAYIEKFENAGTTKESRVDGFVGFVHDDKGKLIAAATDWQGQASEITSLHITWKEDQELPAAFEALTSKFEAEDSSNIILKHNGVQLTFQCRLGSDEKARARKLELPALIAKLKHMIGL